MGDIHWRGKETGFVIIRLVISSFLLIGCSTNSDPSGLGFWKDTYPSNVSEWQCTEPSKPHRNKEC